MTTDEIKQAVQDGIVSAMSDPAVHCRYAITPEDHKRQHLAMEKFIAFTGKIDNLGWSVARRVASWLVISAFTLMLYGAAVKFKVFGG